MAEGKTYNIPAVRFEWFKSKLDTLGRKAKKLNGERLFCTAVGFHNEEDKNSRWHGQKIMEVFVACPEPKLAGWEFVARIDHANEAGNIVRSTGMRDLPGHFRSSEPVCDHCGHKRRRRDTFVVFHETEGYKQVGSSCLKDFLGHGDADRIAKLAELLASIRGFARGSFDGDLRDERFIDTEAYLSCVAETILVRGFVSKKMAFETGATSSASRALDAYLAGDRVSSEAIELAQAALNWAMNLDETEEQPLNDYLHNCWVAANAPVIESRTVGIAASIVGVYHRNQQPKRPVAESQHVGTVGQKLEIEVDVIDSRFLDSGSTLVTMHDKAGNVLKWFASGAGFKRGDSKRIIATVKAHGAYKGRNETIITRAKAL